MTFLKRFLQAWQDAKLHQNYEELADDPEYWTNEDALWLGSMLSHPTGQKLMKRLSNMVIRGAIDATRRTLNPRYHCGIARGMALLKASIDRDFITALELAKEPQADKEEDRELDELLREI